MNFVDRMLEVFNQTKRQGLASSSLQFRLTAGITAASVLGLGGVAVWISWTMQQLLVTTHIRNVEYVAERLPHDVKLYGEMLPMTTAVQRAIDNSASSGLFIWVKSSDGKVLAESQSLQAASASFQGMLMAFSEMPIQPHIYRVSDQSDQYLVLCSSSLAIDRTHFGQIYLAQDITLEQEMLFTMFRNVSIATILVILLLAVMIALYVRRSLQPLRKMSQLAGTISADDLSQARLHLDRAPTEVQELAQMLDKMLSRLSQSWEQQRQFVGNVSHELRTPLCVVSGYLQSLLRRSTSLTHSQKEALEIAASETDRTIRLLQDLLDLARVDSGYLQFHLESIVVNDLVGAIVGMGEKFSDRLITVESDPPTIYLKTDRDRLTQVLVNLIDNAVKYSEPHAPIVVKLAQTELCTTIQVCDQGCGIPLLQQTRIFERFYRVDEARARSTGGVGLGLAIVKSLVEGVGGQVSVWSKLGQGSTFTLTFPNHA
jgi:heavy metal sensor kinase